MAAVSVILSIRSTFSMWSNLLCNIFSSCIHSLYTFRKHKSFNVRIDQIQKRDFVTIYVCGTFREDHSLLICVDHRVRDDHSFLLDHLEPEDQYFDFSFHELLCCAEDQSLSIFNFCSAVQSTIYCNCIKIFSLNGKA